jgi:serine phosphatase RsbU (regulator of sigma subunit)/tetratricopeptide (TPR) repeat protein
MPYYQKSLKLRQSLKNDYDIGYSYSYIGNYYSTKQQYDSALFYHQKALKHRLDTEDTRSIADSYLLIGSTLIKKKKFEEASDYFQKALLKYAQINDKKRLAETYRNYAEVFIAQGNNTDAENFLKQANQLATETGSIDNLILIADELAEIKYSNEEYQAAYDHLRYHTNTFKSTSGEGKYKDIVKNILAYKNEKEKKIRQLEFDQEQERQEFMVYAISTVLILVLFFLIFVFNRLKLTRKQSEIIASKKAQVDKAFIELEIKNKEILDSINYAKRIQSAMLPSKEIINSSFKDVCVLYLPKDIVAGDFYWLEHKDDMLLFAAADCTGHGVPGAMVSVVCHNSLNRSVHEYGITDPAKILDKTKELVVNEFAKSNEKMMDGMDIALCTLNTNYSLLAAEKSCQLKFSGAYNPLWVIRKDSSVIEEYKGDKQPIGKTEDVKSFTTNEITLQEGDTIYIFSDGYVDQFGGEKGKKFKSTNLKTLLLSIQSLTMEEQKLKLHESFTTWSGELEQVDDVCLIGVRI